MTRLHSLLLTLLLACGCGAGEGKEREIPPGPQTNAPPGDLVMYIAEGQGDRIAAYRLGTDGLLSAAPFSTMDVVNPRCLRLRDDILYICARDGVAAATLGPDGRLPDAPTSITQPITRVSAIDMVLVDDVVYVALEELRVVAAYQLEQGQVTPDPISLSGTNSSDYRSIEARGRFIYSAAVSTRRVDTYLINEDGTLDDEPIPQIPQTNVGLPQDLLIDGDNLYAVDGDERRVLQFDIFDNGLLPKDPLTKSKRQEFYARLVIHEGILYASAFNAGRVDLYGLDPETGIIVSDKPFFKTFADVAAFPNDMWIAVGILYVTQSGRDRVDAFILGPDGVPTEFPSSSTEEISGSFPNAVILGNFPP